MFIASNPIFQLIIVPGNIALPIVEDAEEPTVIEPTPVEEDRVIIMPNPIITSTAKPEPGQPSTSTEKPADPKYPGIWRNNSSKFPVITYKTQWATLNVEGWEKRNIPVYFGDNDKILIRGAGQWIGSRFCGQNGKTVLSSHVTNHFYEIEDTEIGTIITMDTIYGSYAYQVTDIVIFDYKDASLLLPEEGKDTLVMYTCYPRENGFNFKDERIALVAKMVSGCQWGEYYDD